MENHNLNNDLKDIVISNGTDGNFDIGFKIILLGEASVGKSSILVRSLFNKFEDYYSATVGFDFATLNAIYKGKNIKLQVWDTCGQEVYRSLISSFYKDSSMAILVYSIDE